MPKVADYSIVTDGDVSLTPGSVKDSPLFNLDAPDTGSKAILMFNLRIENPDDTVLAIRVNPKSQNSEPDFKYTLNSNVTRTMHEVIAGNLLKPTGNIIRFSSSGSGSGRAHFTDVVLLYQHTV